MASADADEFDFRYVPTCSAPECDQAPVCKIVAFWSYGPLGERKNYGLACDRHRESLLTLARLRRMALRVGDDEQVGPVEVMPLAPERVAEISPPQ